MEMWPDVKKEVNEIFWSNIGQPSGTHIWYTDSGAGSRVDNRVSVGHAITVDRTTGSNPVTGAKIYDCFIFNNEIGILERRLSQLHDTVDRFVIVEATKTHSGNPKQLAFDSLRQRFTKYMPKITYIVADDLPEVEGSITDKSWARERHQRDAIMRGLTDCKDNDIIIISDVDEIPSVSAIQSYNGTNEIRSFDMDLYYYNHETKAEETWRESKILPYWMLKQSSPCWARYQKADPIANGGEHLSYFGGVESIQTKLGNTAHREYDTEYYKDPERIQKAIDEKRDLFDRDYVKFQ